MNAATCAREDELLDALGRGFIGAELTQHVETCASCGELRQVAGALLDERAQAMLEAPVPSAGTMWWRMQLRRRQEAQTAARRSLLIGQAATIVMAIALAVVFVGGDLAAGVVSVVTAIRVSTPLLLLMVTWLVAMPIAWVAVRK